jgi:hypothetical protein
VGLGVGRGVGFGVGVGVGFGLGVGFGFGEGLAWGTGLPEPAGVLVADRNGAPPAGAVRNPAADA